MAKYLKYYLSTCSLIGAIWTTAIGNYYPTYFYIGFAIFVIAGDILIKDDTKVDKYSYPFLINLPMYINFPLLIVLISLVVDNVSGFKSQAIDQFFNYLNNETYGDMPLSMIDKISLIATTCLFIGIMGTVPGHELTHRKKNKFDMFIGNWLLAISWDCAFAIEHVYGHHKNVGLPEDPATAKRGENIYKFVIQATINEHLDAWRIERNRLSKKGLGSISVKNRMLVGYMRSTSLTFGAYLIGGLYGTLIYILCAFIAKSLLEVINFTEHYGLVREPGNPVRPRHSWNSNSVISSVLLYNVTRHSSHHEKSHLKFWELKPYQDAPMLPYGYLTMLYTAIFLPFIYHRIMAKKLISWDTNFANNEERKISNTQNKNSGIQLLINSKST